MTSRPAGVVLAAGEGRRLRPLTSLRPKPLCPVGGRPLLEWALDRMVPWCGAGASSLAVNAFHLGDQVVEWIDGRAHVSMEPGLLGTAGALGRLRGWIDGRDVLVTNADALLLPWGTPGGVLQDAFHGVLEPLFRIPLGPGPRLLVTRPGREHVVDFPDPLDARGWRYVGACLLPAAFVARCRPEPSGLFETVWRPAMAAGTLEFVELQGTHVDCGTPADYLAANLLMSGGENVVGEGAVVEGRIEECVVWDGSFVGAHESLRRCVRAGPAHDPLTLQVGAP